MTVSTFVQPNFTSQDAATYKAAIDASVAVLARTGQWFAPHAQSSPDMTVRLDAGYILNDTTLTEVAAQNTSSITAPVTNPRIDRVVVDVLTGAASVVTGTEAASPVAPAIPSGKLPNCKVLLQTSSTTITNSMITDERVGTTSAPAQSGANALINPLFQISNEGTSFVSAANGVYAAECWAYGKAGSSAVHDVSVSTDVPTVAQAGFKIPFSLKMDVTTADAAVAAGDIIHFQQGIEGYIWQQYAERALVLTFWVKATKTGTHSVSLRNGVDRSCVIEYTVSASDTWEKKTILFPASPSAGTWNFTNGVGAYLSFPVICGSTFTGAVGSWQTGDFIGSASAVNDCDNTANNFLIAAPQLEVGVIATPFEIRPYSLELHKTKRYFEKSFNLGTVPAQNAGELGSSHLTPQPVGASVAFQTNSTPFAVPKRAVPAMTFFNPGAANAQARNLSVSADCTGTGSSGTVGESRFSWQATSPAGSAAGNTLAVHWTANARI